MITRAQNCRRKIDICNQLESDARRGRLEVVGSVKRMIIEAREDRKYWEQELQKAKDERK